MLQCTVCGTDIGFFGFMCDRCKAAQRENPNYKYEVAEALNAAHRAPVDQGQPATPQPGNRPQSGRVDASSDGNRSYSPSAASSQSSSSIGIMGPIGILLLIIGAFVLIADPTADRSSTVNLHKLYIGQTAAVVGAIFTAAAYRPRDGH